MLRRSVLSVFVSLLLSIPAFADVSVAERHVQDASLVGEARLKVWLWDVFDARLYAPSGSYDSKQPFALSLSYLRELKGAKIVEATIEEMQNQGRFSKAELKSWEAQLNGLIQDVGPGDTITGVRDSDGYTVLYRDDRRLGKIEDRQFTKGFFDIWLGEKTSKPDLRNRLLSSNTAT